MGDRGEQARGQEAAERPVSKAEDQRKIAAYDSARATVKTEGQTRAFYVLRAEVAEAEVARLREALERVYQIGRGPHVAIARDALNVSYTDEPQGSSPTSSPGESGEGGGAGLDLDRLRIDNGMLHAKLNSHKAIIAGLLEDISLLEAALEEACDWLDNDLAHAPDTTTSMADRELVASWRAALAAAGGGDPHGR